MRLGINITIAMMMIMATVMMFARLIFCLLSRSSKQYSWVLILSPPTDLVRKFGLRAAIKSYTDTSLHHFITIRAVGKNS